MRSIAIVGAGQGGLQLGFGLLRAGYDVTLYSDQTAAELERGAARPVTIQFWPSVRLEEDLGLTFWRTNRLALVHTVVMSVYAPDGTQVLRIHADLPEPAQCVDLRMKFGRWLEAFAARGGHVRVARCDVPMLAGLAASHDLVVVAAGRGAITELFPEDPARCEFDAPQRQVAMFYARDCDMRVGLAGVDGRQVSRYAVLAGVGEVIMSPFLSRSGAEHYYVQYEAVPGAGMDLFDPRGDVAAQYDAGRAWLRAHQPAVHALVAESAVTAQAEWVCGSIRPVVRRPVGMLPGGGAVLGMGDTIIVNDPVLAQGLNGASKWAALLTRQIVAHGGAPFTPEWMQAAFEAYWADAQYNNKLTATALRGMGPLQQRILACAARHPEFARRFMGSIGEAHTLHPWFWDAQAAAEVLAPYESAAA